MAVIMTYMYQIGIWNITEIYLFKIYNVFKYARIFSEGDRTRKKDMIIMAVRLVSL